MIMPPSPVFTPTTRKEEVRTTYIWWIVSSKEGIWLDGRSRINFFFPFEVCILFYRLEPNSSEHPPKQVGRSIACMSNYPNRFLSLMTDQDLCKLCCSWSVYLSCAWGSNPQQILISVEWIQTVASFLPAFRKRRIPRMTLETLREYPGDFFDLGRESHSQKTQTSTVISSWRTNASEKNLAQMDPKRHPEMFFSFLGESDVYIQIYTSSVWKMVDRSSTKTCV